MVIELFPPESLFVSVAKNIFYGEIRYEDLIPIEKTDAPQCVKDLVKKVLELNNRHTFDPQAAKETLLQFSRNVMQTIEYVTFNFLKFSFSLH